MKLHSVFGRAKMNRITILRDCTCVVSQLRYYTTTLAIWNYVNVAFEFIYYILYYNIIYNI